MLDQFIMVAPGSDYGIAMWSDLKNQHGVTFLDYVVDSDNRLLNLLHHLHFSFGLNRRIRLPFQSIWKRSYTLNHCDIDTTKNTCIIFTDISACRTDISFLKHLHEQSNITMVMVLVNVVRTKERLIKERLAFFDLIYSFDRKDCERYGFEYYPTIYSSAHIAEKAEIAYDAFFVGTEKGNRHIILKTIYSTITEAGGKAEIYLSGSIKDSDKITGIQYNKWLSYKSVIEKVLSANCIIDIVDTEVQNGLTLRAMEAICYNKKLLSNNPAVKELKYYDTGYILYLDDIGSVKSDFICTREVVDYHYAGEFSPVNLLTRIQNDYENKQDVS